MEPTFFASAAEFRDWLEENHATVSELLVGFHRKASGHGITYPEALDEVLSFGWIDGVRKRVDAETYAIRFTPRLPGSSWSAVNTHRAEQLIASGRMRPAGGARSESGTRARHDGAPTNGNRRNWSPRSSLRYGRTAKRQRFSRRNRPVTGRSRRFG